MSTEVRKEKRSEVLESLPLEYVALGYYPEGDKYKAITVNADGKVVVTP